MTIKELITELQKHPEDRDVILYDLRMNAHNADSDGTPHGIYHEFYTETIELGDMDGGSKNDVLCLGFTNFWDYDEEFNKID